LFLIFNHKLKIRSNLTAEHNEKAKKTMIENTRLEQHDKPFGFAVE